MASKPPKNGVQLYGGGDRERDQRTRQRRTARIERFTQIQQGKREWINFAEIAEWCSEESSVVPNEVAREAAYQKLQRDLLEEISKKMAVHGYCTCIQVRRKPE